MCTLRASVLFSAPQRAWTSTRGRRVARPRAASPVVAELTAADVKAALNEALQPIQASLDRVEALLDGSVASTEAASIREAVAINFGQGFAKPAHVWSLDDALALLLSDMQADVRASRLQASGVASLKLSDAGLPLFLLRRCQRRCERVAAAKGEAAAPCGAWIRADGSVDVTAMEVSLLAAGDAALTITARKLSSAVGLTREATAERLRAVDGPGLLTLITAALPEKYQSEGDEVPGIKIELGAAGRVCLEKDVDAAFTVLVAEVGVIQGGLDYATAVPQLGVALAILRWLAGTCFGCDPARARLIGRLFVPHSVAGDAHADAEQCERAYDECGYSLRVHAV